ncbi:hypothetical protein GCM10027447_37390 [Glycomyces halotolerans]
MTSKRRTKTPKFYFSLRSPYSWLAHHDLVTGHAALADRLEWIPYWEPDEKTAAALAEGGTEFLYTPMSKEKHHYILRDARRLAADRGLEIAWPVDREPRWEIPHLAYYVAETAGAGRAYVAAAYRARWQQGRDICDRGVVADLAEAVGADPEAAAAASDDPVLRERGAEALARARQDSVFGVPFFVSGFDRYWGVDRLDAFARAVPVPDIPAEARAVAGAEVDDGHAGGCG